MNLLARFFNGCIKHSNALFWMLCALCVVLFGADFIYHKHSSFDFQEWPGFYALYAVLAYAGIITIAKLVRLILKRDNNYYS